MLRLKFELRYLIYRYNEKAQMFIAWHLPKWLVRWTVVRAFAKATTYAGDRHPDEIGYNDVCKAVEHL